MAKLVMLLALCILPELSLATRPMKTPFTVEGRVYCDNCRFTYESSAITYIAGAKVRVECKDKTGMFLKYSKAGTTDSTGTYRIAIAEDHEDQICDAILVSSPQKSCSEATLGRDRARVILTGFNGIASNSRFANAMGFMRTQELAGCMQVLKQMQELDA